MSALILHHYALSPFAEKARLMLGFKGLAWRSVSIPIVMPKPDVIALTGGYRRTPILQIGADVYCDSALIARVLEARQPVPALFPPAAPLAGPLAQWADFTLFWLAVVCALQPTGAATLMADLSPEQVSAFVADRAAFSGNLRRPTLADATVQLHSHLAALQAQLQQQAALAGGTVGADPDEQGDLAALDGVAAAAGPGLLGQALCIADFAAAHPLWFMRRAGPAVAPLLAPYPAVGAWLERVLAVGHGTATAMDSAEALAIAAAAAGHAPCTVAPGMGFGDGDDVTVAATDYGSDPSAGTLVGLSADAAVIRRHDERAGTVHVHFPRQGFQVRKANP